jgi:hypothetical protein
MTQPPDPEAQAARLTYLQARKDAQTRRPAKLLPSRKERALVALTNIIFMSSISQNKTIPLAELSEGVILPKHAAEKAEMLLNRTIYDWSLLPESSYSVTLEDMAGPLLPGDIPHTKLTLQVPDLNKMEDSAVDRIVSYLEDRANDEEHFGKKERVGDMEIANPIVRHARFLANGLKNETRKDAPDRG